MAIVYSTDIFPFYASDVVTEAAILAIDPLRRNVAFEQNLLTLVEVTRAFMETLADADQARMFHYTMSRMLAGTAIDRVYDGLVVSALGNVPSAHVGAADGDTVTVTSASGSDVIVLDNGPFATAAALVAELNLQLNSAVEVVAYADIQGRIGFTNAVAAPGASFTLAAGAGPFLLGKIGLEAGVYNNPVVNRAIAARDDALSHFARNANPIAP